MSYARVRKPEQHRINLSLGDWLIVKKHLTAGDRRAMMRRMRSAGVGPMDYDTSRVGLAKILTYLLDWSILDADGNVIDIRDKPQEFVEGALDSLEPESFTEILQAIDAHDEAMEKEREEEKKSQATASV